MPGTTTLHDGINSFQLSSSRLRFDTHTSIRDAIKTQQFVHISCFIIKCICHRRMRKNKTKHRGEWLTAFFDTKSNVVDDNCSQKNRERKVAREYLGRNKAGSAQFHCLE